MDAEKNMNITMEHVDCDLFGANEYKIRYRKPDAWLWVNQFEFPVVECLHCGLVYVNPRPAVESMHHYYAMNYHDKRSTKEFLTRYSVEAEFLPPLTDEKILDIGCARGDFLIFLKKKYPSINPVGVDLFSDHVNSDEIVFLNKTLMDASFPASYFDIITAWAVFEHLHNPSAYFLEVSKILKKNGKFIFLVTNSESLYGRKAYVEDIPRHIYHFSENILKQYAHKYNFTMTACRYDDRIWDGRGTGTFYHLLQEVFGVTWEKRYFKKINLFQTAAGKAGAFLDRIIFSSHWEAERKRSGIMVVEFVKV